MALEAFDDFVVLSKLFVTGLEAFKYRFVVQ